MGLPEKMKQLTVVYSRTIAPERWNTWKAGALNQIKSLRPSWLGLNMETRNIWSGLKGDSMI